MLLPPAHAFEVSGTPPPLMACSMDTAALLAHCSILEGSLSAAMATAVRQLPQEGSETLIVARACILPAEPAPFSISNLSAEQQPQPAFGGRSNHHVTDVSLSIDAHREPLAQ